VTTYGDTPKRMDTTANEPIPAEIPASTRWLFPEYNFALMTAEAFFPVIVERILNRGSWAEIRWLLDRYERECITQWVQRHGYRRLDKRALHYWCWMLGIQEVHKPPWLADKAGSQAVAEPIEVA
jgi:hypothetical protein